MTKAKQLPHQSPDWNGYTLDELRYMRAYTAARIEINRDRLTSRIRNVSKEGKKGIAPSGMIGKVLGAFSYIDMAIIAWKLGSNIFRIFRTFKRK